jgi:hypothetical protein
VIAHAGEAQPSSPTRPSCGHAASVIPTAICSCGFAARPSGPPAPRSREISRCFSGFCHDFAQVNSFPPCAVTTGIQLAPNFGGRHRCNICKPTTVRQFTQLNTYRAGCGEATSELF